MRIYYNEFDAKAAAWLRELMRAGLIPNGDVDERSIVDVSGTDLAGYEQCHFFAGIGGWALALRLAKWGQQPVWTGSCPCQPYSAAGKQQGKEDSRNLWPAFRRLISERRPQRVFGEQVSGAVGFGWLDRVRSDLEAEAYSIGACVLGAHSVGAPHIRQRLFWVANAGSERRQQVSRRPLGYETSHGGAGWNGIEQNGYHEPSGDGATSGLALSERNAGEPRWPAVKSRTGPAEASTGAHAEPGRCGVSGFWDRYTWLPCLDGKARRIEPGSFPLAYGVSSRMVRLRGYGNAIVPETAAEFVRAFMEITR